jgi:hypothetical protein
MIGPGAGDVFICLVSHQSFFHEFLLNFDFNNMISNRTNDFYFIFVEELVQILQILMISSSR